MLLIDYSLSINGDELANATLPKADSVVKFEISKVSPRGCTIATILQSKTSSFFISILISSYSFALIQCSIATVPSIKIISCDLPMDDSSSPCGLLYSSAHNSLWVLFRSGRFVQYQLQPDLTTGNYSLLFKQSIELVSAESSKKRRRVMEVISWDPCLTAINDRCFIHVTIEGKSALLHFTELEYKTELKKLKLSETPTGLCVSKSHLFILHHGDVNYATLTLSSLSMKNLLTNTSKPQSRTSYCLRVDSTVHDATKLLQDLPIGLLGKKEWSKRTLPSSSSSTEENKILKEKDPSKFEKAAIAFVTKRQSENQGVVSFDLKFLSKFVGRCLLPEGRVLSGVLRKLLLSGSDISINPKVLPALIQTQDIETLFLFLVRIPVICVKDLLTLLIFCLELPPDVIQAFAKRHQWSDRSPMETKQIFLSIVGPQVLRVRCDVMALRRELAKLSMDNVYHIGVFLIALLIDLDNTHEEERLLMEHCECQNKRLYAPSLVEWMNAWIDGNMMRMVMETKTDDRFVK